MFSSMWFVESVAVSLSSLFVSYFLLPAKVCWGWYCALLENCISYILYPCFVFLLTEGLAPSVREIMV